MSSVPARKNCTRCKRWLLTCTGFYTTRRWDDGEARTLGSWCISCQKLLVKEEQAFRKQFGTKAQRRKAEYEAMQRRMAAENGTKLPRRLEQDDDDEMIYEERIRERDGLPKRIPAAPFAAWLRHRIDTEKLEEETCRNDAIFIDRISLRGGVSHDMLRKVANGSTQTLDMDFVERVLFDEDIGVWELYPHLFEEA